MSVLWLMLFLGAVSAVSCSLVAPSLRRLREDQIRQGLFGRSELERLIASSARAVIAMAERQVRLGYFGASLRARAWEGAIVEIDHPSLRHASTWRFPDGEVWLVDLAALPPRDAPRVVIHSLAVPGSPALRIEAYVPGRRDVTLLVTDAQPIALAG